MRKCNAVFYAPQVKNSAQAKVNQPFGITQEKTEAVTPRTDQQIAGYSLNFP
jgi:hypothetical protein